MVVQKAGLIDGREFILVTKGNSSQEPKYSVVDQNIYRFEWVTGKSFKSWAQP